MEFTKYDKLGAYHWLEFEQPGSSYREHALIVADWVGPGVTLDVGAGDGLITWLINAELEKDCVGIDDNPKAVELAAEQGSSVELLSIYDLNVKAKFDNIYCGDVIEHLEFPAKALANMHKALKPNGKLYLVTPPSKPNGKVQDPFHYFEWTEEQLQENVEAQGFKLESIETKEHLKRMYAKFIKQ